ncbi:BTAD domain-containing putative transcriptional regulator [Streptomyces sp. 8N616]|uniref:BTAD domain-containing putative transcriptional regulator n=1 Tax=Streptomyces sp. 8N616 TaxID=3457414 RepID=UPI003FD53482
MTVELGVLGSIEVGVDGRLVDLGHARQRLLLAALLVDVNREVSISQLAERVWGEEPAQRGTLYGYLSRLRQALTAAEGVDIARRSAGYVLDVDPAVVDLYQFRDLVEQARRADGDEQAAALFGRALGLWRGEALAGVGTPWSNTVRTCLHHERLAAELDWADARMRLGQHGGLLPVLRARAGEHPLDERLAGQLMLALYRCGRTAEALGHYQYTRGLLVEELGIDPGPALKRLHQQILTADPALAPGTGARARSAPTAAVSVPVPRQLPAPSGVFTGRTRELAALSAALEGEAGSAGSVPISAIGGMEGIGKTCLALHWAHHHQGLFPDGQLYVNLHGFDPSREPVPPAVAVRGFLDALGVESAAVPAEPAAQAALYRSLVADKRMLMVLDNARDSAQTIPLLPGSPGCMVLITSRHQLAGLVTTHGAKLLTLDTLSEIEARQLLTRHLGEHRLRAEPDAVTAILKRCAGVPLALSIAAARAAIQPGLPLAHLAEELPEADITGLDALAVAGAPADDLRTALSCL